MSLVSSVSNAVIAQTMVPEDSGGPYVAAAYVVFLVLIAVYVAIMAQRLGKISRQAAELEARLGAANASTGAGAVQGGSVTGAAAPPAQGDDRQKVGS
ncbi:MAG: hypothetical protein Q7T55_01610 [Solirubrobacteraceae bacterium]|nr:hypothetical protein [Solirubrobacteraceae bacterium]